MAWTYSGNPAASPLDAVRFAVGDTREKLPLLQDEEIAALLVANGGDITGATVAACRGILFQLGRLRDESVGSVSISYSQQFDHYKQLLSTLQGQLGVFGAFTVYAGGTSLSDSRAIVSDPDRIPPGFYKRRPEGEFAGILATSPQFAGEAQDTGAPDEGR